MRGSGHCGSDDVIKITPEDLKAIMPGVDDKWVDVYAEVATGSAKRFEINTPLRLAAWFGNMAYESGQLNYWGEVYPPASLGLWYGRGPMQLTGKENYVRAGDYLGYDLFTYPDRVKTDTGVGFDTAAWFFRYGNGDQNVFADEGNFWECYKRVLGGDDGSYTRRKVFYDRALAVFSDGVVDDGDEGSNSVVTGQDIVNAAYELLYAPYRLWQPGMSLPTWLDDGRGDPPPITHLKTMGVECADLVAYALARNGLDYPYGAGTGTFADFLVGWDWFDPSTPGQAGAVCMRPYAGPAWADQGHIAIYVDEHTLIQAIGSGVTDQFTDTETWGWGGATEFTLYGFLPGVDYSAEGDSGELPDESPGESGGLEIWEEFGWWTYASRDSWDLKYHYDPPKPRS